MKSDELFLEIKNKISNKEIKKNEKFERNNYKSKIASFNYNLYNEILNREIKDISIEEIDNKLLIDLKYSLDYFFNKYPTNNPEFDEFVKYICIYLLFIEKKPFHPVGLEIKNKILIFKKNSKYYCGLKEKYKEDENSLCKFCVSLSLS
ncbi:MAG: DUF2115 family protein [Methanobacteriaceae archaeon]|jgi:uncharacterized protein (UPF0305 family)|nr:DUF2115 family protein [Methanobacteriaceae archaeon]